MSRIISDPLFEGDDRAKHLTEDRTWLFVDLLHGSVQEETDRREAL